MPMNGLTALTDKMGCWATRIFRLRAWLEIGKGAATGDFGLERGGAVGASP